jgi:hypothetical protein
MKNKIFYCNFVKKLTGDINCHCCTSCHDDEYYYDDLIEISINDRKFYLCCTMATRLEQYCNKKGIYFNY